MATKIPWTQETWNPVIGCSKIAAGCKNCYAEKMAHRLSAMECKQYEDANPQYSLVVKSGHWNGHVICRDSELDKPLHWKKPRKIFVCSMSDLFHEKVPFGFVDKVWDIINIARSHTFQILTKRPKRALEYAKRIESFRFHSNLWLGVSCSTQADLDKNVPILLQIAAAVRFVSLEPLLEEVDIKNPVYKYVSKGYWKSDYISRQLHWIIVGCESGPKRRPCSIEAVRGVVRQCQAADVPVFVKQIEIGGRCEKDPAKWPEDLRVQEYPK